MTTGPIIGDLNSRRAHIQGQDMRGNANVIDAMVPLANMLGYVTTLRSISQDARPSQGNSIALLRWPKAIHQIGLR